MRWRQSPLLYGLVLTAVISAGGWARGEPPGHYSFRAYGLDEGLTNFAVLSLTQDPQGLVWVGTEDGLFSYDGQRFSRLGSTDGLPVGSIVELAVDAQGAVLVGTEGGLGRVVGGKTSIVREVPAHRVASLAVDAQGCSWVCVEQPTEGLWRSCSGQPFVPVEGWGAAACTSVSLGGPGEVFVATPTGLSLRQATGGWTQELVDWHGERIDAVARDGSGRVWARSLSRLLVRSPGEATFTFADEGLPRAYLDGHLTIGPDGELWVATVEGVAHRRGGAWDFIGERHGLRGLVNAIFFDAEGSVWLGGLGLRRWLGSGHLRSTGGADGLPNEIVWAIARAPDGALLVGTDDGLSSGTTERWAQLPFSWALGIKAIVTANDGSVWLGASPLQVLRWTPKTGAVERYTTVDGLAGSQVASLLLDPEGTLWVGTERGGLFGSRTGPDGKVHFVRAELPDASPTEIFGGLSLDAEGRVWAAGAEGLAVREGGRWRRFTEKDGLPERYQAFVAPRAAGGVWVAGWSSTGVLPATLRDGRLVLGDPLLVGRKVYSLGEDAQHRLYVGTGSGLAIVEPGEGVRAVTELTQRDGLPGDDCDANAFWADPDGEVWVGMSTGLVRLRAAGLTAPRPAPRTIIERAQLGDRLLDGAPATVEHTQNTLDVHFAAMSYVNERKVRYQTRLLGLSNEWREVTVPEERFTNLPPGSYTFETRAALGGGPWGPTAQVGFVVRPAVWQTGWARAAMLGALLGLVALAVWWRRAAAEGARAKRSSEELLQSVFSVIREGVLVREPSGAPAIWNTAAEHITGLSGAQIRGEEPLPEGWRVLREDGVEMPAADRPGITTRVTGQREPVQVIAFAGGKGRPLRWAQVSTEPVSTVGPGPYPTVTTISDVTDQVQARETLRKAMEASNEASKLKSQFLANMSHEIRTPLNAVLGLTRLAKDEPLSPRLAEYLELIERSGDGLLGLVNDLLDFSKIEAGKLTLERIAFSVKELLEQLQRVFAPALTDKGLRVVLRVDAAVGEVVLGDPLRVRQVLTNLMSNAIKFTMREGAVELVARRSGDDVRFEITDTGIGMNEEQLGRLFEAFRQGDATTTRKFGGTGLGLAISRSLARAMGGDLEVQSTEGRGSTFAFQCPLPLANVTAPSRSVVRVPDVLRGKRVLLVDDNSVNRLVGRALLVKAGVEVTIAEDGEHALVQVCNADAPFDAVLMDVQMPVMDGYQATAEIRRRLGERTPPIVAVTAHAMMEQRAESMAAGMVAHVTKPIDPAELYSVLERLFAPR